MKSEVRDDLIRNSQPILANKSQMLGMPQFGLRDNLIKCELLKNEDAYTYIKNYRCGWVPVMLDVNICLLCHAACADFNICICCFSEASMVPCGLHFTIYKQKWHFVSYYSDILLIRTLHFSLSPMGPDFFMLLIAFLY